MTEREYEGPAPRPEAAPEGQERLFLAPADRDMIGAAHRDAGDTETEAAAANIPGKASQRGRVLELYREHPAGLTDFEVHALLELRRPHIAGTRREELIRDGHRIVDTGERRPTDTGRNAIVWALA